MALTPYEILQKQKEIKKDFVNKKGKISNDFVNGFMSNTNLITLKILFYIVGKQHLLDQAQISNIKKREQVKLSVSNLCKECDIDKKTLIAHTKRMLETVITMVDTEEELTVYALISKFTFQYNNDTVIIDIYREILDKLLEVVIPYTIVDIKNILSLKFKHSMKMILQLEMISRYDKDLAKRKHYMFEELQLLFGTNYKTYTAFKKNVLDKIKNDLDQNSNLTFVFDTHSDLQKVGRPKISKVIIDVVDNKRQGTLF